MSVGAFYAYANAKDSVAVGGDGNRANALKSVAVDGESNVASGDTSVALGGFWNTTYGEHSATLGGALNTASGDNSSVIGGRYYYWMGGGARVAGGRNVASGPGSVILGGANNVTTAAASQSVVVGGKGGKATQEYAVAIGGGQANAKNSVAIGNGVETSDKQYEVAIGSSNTNKLTFGDTNIAASGQKIINVAAGTNDSDVVVVSQLKKVSSDAKLYTDKKTEETLAAAKGYTDEEVKKAITGSNYTGTENIEVDNDKRTIALKDNVKLTDAGSLKIGESTVIDNKGFEIVENPAGKIAKKTEISTNGMQIADNSDENVKALAELSPEAVAVTRFEEGNNKQAYMDYDGYFAFSGPKDDTVEKIVGVTTGTNYKGQDYEAGLYVGDETKNEMSSLTSDKLTVANKTYIDKNEINANGQKITNVADGTIAQGSKDAVNGGQLWDAYKSMSNVDNRLYNMDNRINDVYNDVSGVGSQAAALSALQAIPYNPYAPTTVTAGLGFYRSDQAVAVGIYHYIRDSVLVNVGGAFNLNGHGDAMGRAGISFLSARAPAKAASRSDATSPNFRTPSHLCAARLKR